MDVWTLGEKYKKAQTEIEDLRSRIDHIEVYLSELTEVKDETLQGKPSKSPSVRTRRRTTKKSKGSK
jgi:hypothetical protein